MSHNKAVFSQAEILTLTLALVYFEGARRIWTPSDKVRNTYVFLTLL